MESPIHALLRADRRVAAQSRLGHRRLGLAIVVVSAAVTAGFLAWLAVHLGL